MVDFKHGQQLGSKLLKLPRAKPSILWFRLTSVSPRSLRDVAVEQTSGADILKSFNIPGGLLVRSIVTIHTRMYSRGGLTSQLFVGTLIKTPSKSHFG